MSDSDDINLRLKELIAKENFDSNFENNLYNSKIFDIMTSLKDKNYFIFNGPCLSGKSKALDIIQSVATKLNGEGGNYLPISYVKVFPKAFDERYMFSENDKKNAIQFYSKNIIIKINFRRFLLEPNQATL